jgi:hypothetical protein
MLNGGSQDVGAQRARRDAQPTQLTCPKQAEMNANNCLIIAEMRCAGLLSELIMKYLLSQQLADARMPA